MLTFEKTIVHIVDSEHNTCIQSTSCLTAMDADIEKMLTAKGEKVFHSANRKCGSFKENSQVKNWIIAYRNQELSFEDCASHIVQRIFDFKMKYAQYRSSDVVVSEVLQEGRRYLLVIENAYTQGLTHHLEQGEDEICTQIITYRTLLSPSLVKNDRAFLVELSDLTLHCVESKVEIEAEKVNFFVDLVLEGTSDPSYQETIRNMTKLTGAMSEKYELDEVEILPKMKSIIKDHVEQGKAIVVDEIAESVFASVPLARDDFKQELKEKGVPKEIGVEYIKPARSEKVQKIKTDRGIEIIIPIDYMNEKDVVEFKTQSDGTISIQLKNISHITSK